MSQLSFSSFDASLMVRDAQGRYLLATADQILEAARQAVTGIRELCDDLGIPARLRDAGVSDERFDEMATLCTQANYNRWNPRHTTTAEFLELFRKAY